MPFIKLVENFFAGSYEPIMGIYGKSL